MKINKSQWVRFSIVALLYVLFMIWVGNYWLLLGLPVIVDIYLTKFVPWSAWKKSENKFLKKTLEWVDAILFALVAVYIIHLFFFQNYKIPSSSLEKTLLVGDYLFVSKMSYGPRVPNTPLSFPLAQHTLPILNCKSYIDWPQWEYRRLKGFGDVKRNDIVVFNFPAGDTVALNMQNPDYYTLCHVRGRAAIHTNKKEYGDIVFRPVDRRENYVKRCIGMPGDSLMIRNNDVFINGELLQEPEHMQLNYLIYTNGAYITDEQFELLGVSKDDYNKPQVTGLGLLGKQDNFLVYRIPLTRKGAENIKRFAFVQNVFVEPAPENDLYYPLGYGANWNRDNYGPIWIPEKGTTIVLNENTVALYERCIVNYEGNTLRKEGDIYLLNGQPANSFTFKYDYYFMMGDNRHNSADSRSWGFVPEDHVVGKPILVWLSMDKDRSLFKGIRWSRLFTMVHSD